MQYLVQVSWYENHNTGIIYAENEDKALRVFLNSIMDLDKQENYTEDSSLPLFCYDEDLTRDENIEKYIREYISTREVYTNVLEVPQHTSSILYEVQEGNRYREKLIEV